MSSNFEGDVNIEQFRTLVNCQMNAFKFKNFKQSEYHLNQICFETLEVLAKSLRQLLQSSFVLYNGQTEVEKGFSINIALLKNSMKEETITPRRRIKNYMYACRLELHQVNVSKDMQMSVTAARSRYDVFFRVLRFSFSVKVICYH